MKIWTPDDFPAPNLEAIRADLINKIDANFLNGIYKKTFDNKDKSLFIQTTIDCDYQLTVESQLDICTWYANHGKWKSVDVVKVPNAFKYTFEFKK
jgi:hypothetical protein